MSAHRTDKIFGKIFTYYFMSAESASVKFLHQNHLLAIYFSASYYYLFFPNPHALTSKNTVINEGKTAYVNSLSRK